MYSPILKSIYFFSHTNMTKRPPFIPQKQLFQAINEYLQNLGMGQSFNQEKSPNVRQLELAVRSLNLQRQPYAISPLSKVQRKRLSSSRFFEQKLHTWVGAPLRTIAKQWQEDCGEASVKKSLPTHRNDFSERVGIFSIAERCSKGR